MYKIVFLSVSCVVLFFSSPAQQKLVIREHLRVLCAKSYGGRGYVNKGVNKAGKYLSGQFSAMGLEPFQKDFQQKFSFPVNTFPSRMDVKENGRTLKPGVDYLVDPASKGYVTESQKVIPIDFQHWTDKEATKRWEKLQRKMQKKTAAYLLLHTDSLVSKMGWTGTAEVNHQLPRGLFLMPRQGKPLWSVARKEIEPTLVYVYDTLAFQQRKSRWTAHIDNRFIAEYPSENIIGRVPGTVQKDSFIVVTAHYDHLGKMGASAMFPGASDNASGTAMLLALAQYYASHPQPYTMVFIAFAGEEAGLMGSRYFVEHPLFDLAAIRFLINLDIMGDASNGITVVNGSVHPQEFDLLQKVNIGAKPVARIKTSPLIGERDEEERASIDDTAIQTEADAPREIPEIAGLLLPEIKVRGAAANSDHYPFSEKGVPAFFIFTNGGPGYYHDVWDKPEQVSLANIEELSELLFRFITALQ